MLTRRRVGRPRTNWTEETVKEIWDHLKKDKERYMFMAFDDNNDDIMAMIREHAAKEVTTTGSRSL